LRRVILIPVYNDWRAVEIVISKLDSVLAKAHLETDIVLVDDGSTQPVQFSTERWGLTAVKKVSILELRRNLGHQRAIAVGLAYVSEILGCDELVLMDGDGEDQPEDIPRLLEELHTSTKPCIVFAERARRSENLQFRIGYSFYKALHLLLTGERVRFGNFSAIPGSLLKKVVSVSEIWNHFVAGVIVAKLPYSFIPTYRGKRVDGKSHMNFKALVLHGLRALSVFSDAIGLQVLMWLGAISAITVVALLGIFYLHFFTSLPIPGWTSTVAGLLFVVLAQSLTLAMLFLFTILSSRSMLGMIPLRDYGFFAQNFFTLFDRQLEERLATSGSSASTVYAASSVLPENFSPPVQSPTLPTQPVK
jgi:glycosyltransferase involved in cell wall biosynthesis